MFSPCSIYVLSMFHLCCVHVWSMFGLWSMFCLCSVYTMSLSLFRLCSIYVPPMLDHCSVNVYVESSHCSAFVLTNIWLSSECRQHLRFPKKNSVFPCYSLETKDDLSMRILAKTSFCGEWNLEFGSNTTEKFEISRGKEVEVASGVTDEMNDGQV